MIKQFSFRIVFHVLVMIDCFVIFQNLITYPEMHNMSTSIGEQKKMRNVFTVSRVAVV